MASCRQVHPGRGRHSGSEPKRRRSAGVEAVSDAPRADGLGRQGRLRTDHSRHSSRGVLARLLERRGGAEALGDWRAARLTGQPVPLPSRAHMTFYEAALRVLEAAGQPLTSVEITERSIAQGLLSHVGKTPEQTMLSRLAAMARRTRDRQVTVTAPDTFALTAWGLPEDAAALEAMSAPYEHPEEGLAPAPPGRAPPRAAQRERAWRRPAGAPAPARGGGAGQEAEVPAHPRGGLRAARGGRVPARALRGAPAGPGAAARL